VGDNGRQEIRERVWVEKFDHEAETPTLVETVFCETTRVVEAPTGLPEPVAPLSEST
jgi:hypothetical protein